MLSAWRAEMDLMITLPRFVGSGTMSESLEMPSNGRGGLLVRRGRLDPRYSSVAEDDAHVG